MSPRRPILILGASGQVGRRLLGSISGTGEIVALDRNQADLSDFEQLRTTVRRIRPEVILNAAAYTAVDRAESEPDRAIQINGTAPGVLAEESERADALLVHYSTDYVFDGSKATPWVETDLPHPLNVYGASKLAGEKAIEKVGGKFLIFRTSWVYGPQGNNFLLTMLRLGRERDRLNIVDDQIGAPTTSLELANATSKVVKRVLGLSSGSTSEWAGVYHMTCGGSVSWCDFARAIFDRAQTLLQGKKPEIHPIPSTAYPTPARRPGYSVLSNDKLRLRFGVQLAGWEPALDQVMGELATGVRA